MSDERRRDAALAKERFFERQNDRELSHRSQLPHPTGRPGPHLGSDVIEDGDPRGGGLRSHAQMVAGIVDENHQIVASGPEREADAAEHGPQEALELELEGLRFRRLEPDVLHDLLERGRAETLPTRLQPEKVPAALGQVERAVTGRLEDPELAGAFA